MSSARETIGREIHRLTRFSQIERAGALSMKQSATICEICGLNHKSRDRRDTIIIFVSFASLRLGVIALLPVVLSKS
jgi:hypothetical protein